MCTSTILNNIKKVEVLYFIAQSMEAKSKLFLEKSVHQCKLVFKALQTTC